MKIVILDGYTENPGDLSWDGFAKLGELRVYERTPASMIAERIADAEAVITNKTPISAQTLEQCPSVRYIGVLATGYNVVDVEAAKSRGIPVCNIPTYGTEAVAQYTFALLLELCHHVAHHSDAVHQGRWTNHTEWCFWDYPLMELAGKTMGIIGFGRIGKAVACIARAFGMKVLAYDKYAQPDGETVLTDLDTLLSQSDVVSLHCPLFPDTAGMIDAQALAKMKPQAILLNTARGPLVNEADLAQALNTGNLYAAAVDVVSVEPIAADNPLLTAQNCLITPHIAWAARETRERLMKIAVENLDAFIQGKVQNNVWE